MAFATTNVRLGSAGDKFRLTGNWTATQGDADGTVAVAGANVTSCTFNIGNSADGDRPVPTQKSTNTTTGVTTITVRNADTVTDGYFSIEYN